MTIHIRFAHDDGRANDIIDFFKKSRKNFQIRFDNFYELAEIPLWQKPAGTSIVPTGSPIRPVDLR